MNEDFYENKSNKKDRYEYRKLVNHSPITFVNLDIDTPSTRHTTSPYLKSTPPQINIQSKKSNPVKRTPTNFKLPPVDQTSVNTPLKHQTPPTGYDTPQYSSVTMNLNMSTLQKIKYLSDKTMSEKRKKFANLDASAMDDIMLKKTLAEAFDADPNSYLGALQQSVEKGALDQSDIPREYYVYSNSLLAHGFRPNDEEDVTYNPETNTWSKLIFPSKKPNRRIEIYLLAKTMDEMLAKLNEGEKQPEDVDEFTNATVEKMSKSFLIHLTALKEIARQTATHSIERAILIHKIHKFLKTFFDITIEMIQTSRQAADESQKAIKEYKKIMDSIEEEKKTSRLEIERLLKENTLLFKQKEELKRELLIKSQSDAIADIFNEEFHQKIMSMGSRTINRPSKQRDKFVHLEQPRREKSPSEIWETQQEIDSKKGEKENENLNQSWNKEDGTCLSYDFIEVERLSTEKRELLSQRKQLKKNVKNLWNSLRNTTKHVETLRALAEKGFGVTIQSKVRDCSDIDSEFRDNLLPIRKIRSAIIDMNVILADLVSIQRKRCELIDSLNRINTIISPPVEEGGKIRVRFMVPKTDARDVPIDSARILIESDSDGMSNSARERAQSKVQLILDERKKKSEEEQQQQLAEKQLEEKKMKDTLTRIGRTLDEQQRDELNRIIEEISDAKDKKIQSLEEENNSLLNELQQIKYSMEDSQINLLVQQLETLENEKQMLFKQKEEAEQKLRSIYENTDSSHEEQPDSANAKLKRVSCDKDIQASVSTCDKDTQTTQLEKTNETRVPTKRLAQKSQSRSEISALRKTDSKELINQESKMKPVNIQESKLKQVNNQESKSTDSPTTKPITPARTPGTPTRMRTPGTPTKIKTPGTPTRPSNLRNTSKPKKEHKKKTSNKKATKPKMEKSIITEEKDEEKLTEWSDSDKKILSTATQHSKPNAPHKTKKKSRSVITADKEILTDDLIPKETFNRYVQTITTYMPEETKLLLPKLNFSSLKSHETTKAITAPKSTFRVKNSRLLELLNSQQVGKLKSLTWLLKLITNVYKAKLYTDSLDDKIIHERSTLPSFLFEYLRQLYGTAKLVDEYACAIITTIRQYQDEDERVKIFSNFLREVWELPILNMFLKSWKLLEDSTIGPEFSKPGDEQLLPAKVSKVRCLYVLSALKEELKDVIHVILQKMERVCITADDEEYEMAVALSGHKVKGVNAIDVKTQWGVDEYTARQMLTKAQFLGIICSVLQLKVEGRMEAIMTYEETDSSESESSYFL